MGRASTDDAEALRVQGVIVVKQCYGLKDWTKRSRNALPRNEAALLVAIAADVPVVPWAAPRAGNQGNQRRAKRDPGGVPQLLALVLAGLGQVHEVLAIERDQIVPPPVVGQGPLSDDVLVSEDGPAFDRNGLASGEAFNWIDNNAALDFRVVNDETPDDSVLVEMLTDVDRVVPCAKRPPNPDLVAFFQTDAHLDILLEGAAGYGTKADRLAPVDEPTAPSSDGRRNLTTADGGSTG